MYGYRINSCILQMIIDLSVMNRNMPLLIQLAYQPLELVFFQRLLKEHIDCVGQSFLFSRQRRSPDKEICNYGINFILHSLSTMFSQQWDVFDVI